MQRPCAYSQFYNTSESGSMDPRARLAQQAGLQSPRTPPREVKSYPGMTEKIPSESNYFKTQSCGNVQPTHSVQINRPLAQQVERPQYTYSYADLTYDDDEEEEECLEFTEEDFSINSASYGETSPPFGPITNPSITEMIGEGHYNTPPCYLNNKSSACYEKETPQGYSDQPEDLSWTWPQRRRVFNLARQEISEPIKLSGTTSIKANKDYSNQRPFRENPAAQNTTPCACPKVSTFTSGVSKCPPFQADSITPIYGTSPQDSRGGQQRCPQGVSSRLSPYANMCPQSASTPARAPPTQPCPQRAVSSPTRRVNQTCPQSASTPARSPPRQACPQDVSSLPTHMVSQTCPQSASAPARAPPRQACPQDVSSLPTHTVSQTCPQSASTPARAPPRQACPQDVSSLPTHMANQACPSQSVPARLPVCSNQKACPRCIMEPPAIHVVPPEDECCEAQDPGDWEMGPIEAESVFDTTYIDDLYIPQETSLPGYQQMPPAENSCSLVEETFGLHNLYKDPESSKYKMDVPESIADCEHAKRCGLVEVDKLDHCRASNKESQRMQAQIDRLVKDAYCPGVIQESVDGLEDFNVFAFKLAKIEAHHVQQRPTVEPLSLLEAFSKRINLEREALKTKVAENATKDEIRKAVKQFFTEGHNPTDLNRSLNSHLLTEQLMQQMNQEEVSQSSFTADVQKGAPDVPENDGKQFIVYTAITKSVGPTNETKEKTNDDAKEKASKEAAEKPLDDANDAYNIGNMFENAEQPTDS